MKSLLLLSLLASTITCQFSPSDLIADIKYAFNETFSTRRQLNTEWDKFIFGFQRGGTKVQTRKS